VNEIYTVSSWQESWAASEYSLILAGTDERHPLGRFIGNEHIFGKHSNVHTAQTSNTVALVAGRQILTFIFHDDGTFSWNRWSFGREQKIQEYVHQYLLRTAPDSFFTRHSQREYLVAKHHLNNDPGLPEWVIGGSLVYYPYQVDAVDLERGEIIAGLKIENLDLPAKLVFTKPTDESLQRWFFNVEATDERNDTEDNPNNNVHQIFGTTENG
jgi:hypothetical protein